METKDRLKNIKTRVPYYSHKLTEIQIRELDELGSTIIELPLRYKYPMLTGIKFEKDRIAVITNRLLWKSKWHYYLESDQKEKGIKTQCKKCLKIRCFPNMFQAYQWECGCEAK